MVEQFDYNISPFGFFPLPEQRTLRFKLSSDAYVFDTRSIDQNVFSIVKKSEFDSSLPKPTVMPMTSLKTVSVVYPGIMYNCTVTFKMSEDTEIVSITHHREDGVAQLYGRCVTTVVCNITEDDDAEEEQSNDSLSVVDNEALTQEKRTTISSKQDASNEQNSVLDQCLESGKEPMTALALFESLYGCVEKAITDYALIMTAGFSESPLTSEWSHYAKAYLSLVDCADRANVAIMPPIRNKWLCFNAVSAELMAFLKIAVINKSKALADPLQKIVVRSTNRTDDDIKIEPPTCDASLIKVIQEAARLLKKLAQA